MLQILQIRLIVAMLGVAIVPAQAMRDKNDAAMVVASSRFVFKCLKRQTRPPPVAPRGGGAKPMPGKSHLSLYV